MMIDKQSVFVVSSGRTGTTFFGDLFSRIWQNCDSFHEPDAVRSMNPLRLREHAIAIRRFGIYQYLIGKACSTGNLRSLSKAYVAGRVEEDVVIAILRKFREAFVNTLPGDYYVESNNNVFGIIDVLPRLFRNLTVLFIVRDGRDWVRSQMNFSKFYAFRTRRLWGVQRLTPADVGDIETMKEWPKLSQFERLCWQWTAMNEIGLDGMQGIERGQVYRFEDIFASPNRCDVLVDLVDFATQSESSTFCQADCQKLLANRFNAAPRSSFPKWDRWTSEQKSQFQHRCGALMNRLGYW